MAWLTIPDASVDPESPAIESLFRALRDNPVAIAQGAAGAPKVQDAAFSDNSIRPQILSNGAAWVAATVIGFGVGGVGTYAILTGNADYDPGDTAAGSALSYAGILSAFYNVGTPTGDVNVQTQSGASPAGTWRCQGMAAVGTSTGPSDIGSTFRTCLWVRIA